MSFRDDGDDDFNESFRFRHKNPYSISGKIMVTAITSLSIVIVVVAALHIYARCALRRQARRRRAVFHGLGLTVNQVHEPPKGLDPTVIASLPIFVVKQTDGQDRDTMTPVECAVCLSLLEEEEMARLLPNCKHTFHAECIDKWLTSHSTCPICRAEAEPRLLQPEPREGPAGEAASAPPVDRALVCIEGSSESDGGAKFIGSSPRLNSFRRMLSRDRSFRRLQEDHSVDLERQ
ncbi:E3 ubiquitin-protein ligase ATL41-like [Tripterygium wilfordii]|uniref:RING-type E3 ubiquitin transferase n=1 Tax=Tripterygium wilfordii TaxID=458696 RepID=A0A7J7CBD5_TRIWF|nr:E3 ubiquitin-protein ligase ATL41-like [Tripterygium wilfordii]KAF5731400.1 E3 ubiquitin-protein ligase ATL41-like [Tripterygium wilfordii]